MANSLQTFQLSDLAQFTKEGSFSSEDSPDFHVFMVGVDNVHGVLKYLLSLATRSMYISMFGFDDEELNDLIMKSAMDDAMTTVVTLDKSQAGGKHEKQILDSDAAKYPDAYKAHFAIGQSATHQINHLKAGVLDGIVAFEGSTNWSISGEGTFVPGQDHAGGPGYKAQNNSLTVFTNQSAIARFTAILVNQHMVAVQQGGQLSPKATANTAIQS